MSTDTVVLSLKSLKLFGMAGAVAELAEQGAPAYQQSTAVLDQLIRAEVAEREVRSINYQMKIARFPAHHDLTGFAFKDSAVNEALVRTLHRCEFLHQTENIVLIGGPGTGKTHLATAIAVQAIVQHHRRVRFLSTVELVNALEQEKRNGHQGRLPNALSMPI
jgi:DNA replication protein DnaC